MTDKNGAEKTQQRNENEEEQMLMISRVKNKKMMVLIENGQG